MERRPVILRNTTVNGVVSFVEWTPAAVFPDGDQHYGMHCAVFDANQDGRVDIFLGGNRDDHLFHQRLTTTVKESVLNEQLPNFHQGHPISVLGNGLNAEVDSFTAHVPNPGQVSIVLRSTADTALTVCSDGMVIASSNRGGIGIEEALQFVSPGALTIEVEMVGGASKPRPYVLEVLSR